MALVFALSFGAVAHRTGFLLVGAVALFFLFRPIPSRCVAMIWLAMGVALFSPLDVSFTNRPGPPHFAPLVMGYPARGANQAAKRGQIVLGGCVVNGFEPRLVWVW